MTYAQPGKHTEEELAKALEGLPASPKPSVQHYKGLGKMGGHQLWETTMSLRKRLMARVSVDDAIEADQTFEMLMGDRAGPRRAFIGENVHYVRNLDT